MKIQQRCNKSRIPDMDLPPRCFAVASGGVIPIAIGMFSASKAHQGKA